LGAFSEASLNVGEGELTVPAGAKSVGVSHGTNSLTKLLLEDILLVKIVQTTLLVLQGLELEMEGL
jgi:hypothetical protein